MALVDPRGKHLKVNDALCRFLGYNRDELHLIRFNEPTHPEDVIISRGLQSRLMAGEIDHAAIEKRLYDKNGRLVWARAACHIVRDPTGAPLYFISQHQDITALKRSERLLLTAEKLLDRLAGKDLSATELLAAPDRPGEARSEPLDPGILDLAELLLRGPSEDFGARLAGLGFGLTATELEVAEAVWEGRSSTRIADELCVSPATVAFHRRNIRKKLGLRSKRPHLTAHLRALLG